MGHFGRSIIFAGVASSLLGRNGFYYYSEKEVSEEFERILSMSPQEYRASLPTYDRCTLLLQIYEMAVIGPGWDPDEASITKRELLDTCPKWCSKVVEKVDNTSPKVSSQELIWYMNELKVMASKRAGHFRCVGLMHRWGPCVCLKDVLLPRSFEAKSMS